MISASRSGARAGRLGYKPHPRPIEKTKTHLRSRLTRKDRARTRSLPVDTPSTSEPTTTVYVMECRSNELVVQKTTHGRSVGKRFRYLTSENRAPTPSLDVSASSFQRLRAWSVEETPPSSRVVRQSESPDALMVRALKAGESSAAELLFDRYYAHVCRVLVHVIGPDAEIADLVQEVFLAALDSIGKLRDASALRSWIGSIAVHTARRRLRQRKRLRLFELFPADEPPEKADTRAADPELDEAVRATYRVLECLGSTDRVVFALRFIEGCELAEIAELSETSTSTVKRRLARAVQRFIVRARLEPSLAEFLEGAPWAQ
jgi:RNA polymerase sigma-70 factor (ECF subfamily)